MTKTTKLLAITALLLATAAPALALDDDDQTGDPPWLPDPIGQGSCHLSSCGGHGDIGNPGGGVPYGGWGSAYPCSSDSSGGILWDTCAGGAIPAYSCTTDSGVPDYDHCWWTSGPGACLNYGPGALDPCTDMPDWTSQTVVQGGTRWEIVCTWIPIVTSHGREYEWDCQYTVTGTR